MRDTIRVACRCRRKGFTLDVDMEVPDTGVTGIFGRSGSGKTTLLRCIAGLEPAAHGSIRIGDEVLQDDAQGIREPAHRRRIGFVFQDSDLFQHLSVRRNLEYARRRARPATLEAGGVSEWLGLARLMERAPDGLSGGERQRVAIARALLSGARLLLMDEPLAALDEAGRQAIFPYIEAVVRNAGVPLLYVSHSLTEIAKLADRLVWLEGGGVRAVGPVAEVAGRLDFAHWRGEGAVSVTGATVVRHDREHHLTVLASPWGPLRVRLQSRPADEQVRVQVLASDVSIGRSHHKDTSIVNQFALRVTELEAATAGEVLIRMEGPRGGAPLLARITSYSLARLGIGVGDDVFARVKSVAVID